MQRAVEGQGKAEEAQCRGQWKVRERSRKRSAKGSGRSRKSSAKGSGRAVQKVKGSHRHHHHHTVRLRYRHHRRGCKDRVAHQSRRQPTGGYRRLLLQHRNERPCFRERKALLWNKKACLSLRSYQLRQADIERREGLPPAVCYQSAIRKSKAQHDLSDS